MQEENFPSVRECLQMYERKKSDTWKNTDSATKQRQTRMLPEGGHSLISIRERKKVYERGKGTDQKEETEEHGLVSLAGIVSEEFRVNDKALERFLRKDELKHMPIVIISIAGAFRSGKSFIMNFFIRYLREKGWRNQSWFGKEDDKITDGFTWERGSVACTKGIHVWSEVFHAPLSDGRDAAVLLVDTQGLFDGDTSPDVNAKIMSISTLFCSHQILNLMRQIEERDLEHLQLCVAFSKAATSTGGQSKPFQTLTFLLRDWEHDEKLLGDSTDEYLREYFGKRSRSEDVQKVKDSIPAAFNEVKCFLLPHPGKKVIRCRGTDLKNEDMDEDFQEYTKQLVETILDPLHLVAKRTKSGKEATVDDLLRIIKMVGKSFASGELPKAKTLLQYMEGTTKEKALNAAVSAYKERISELRRRAFYVVEEDWSDYHERSLKLAMIQFRYMTNMQDEDGKLEYLTRLRQKCDDELERFKYSTTESEWNDRTRDQDEQPDFVRNYKTIDSFFENGFLSPTQSETFFEGN